MISTGAERLENQGLSPGKGRDAPLFHHGAVVHLASYPVGVVGIFPWV
jgi:hypothetical protein